jgi:hypothetical protein
MTRSQWNPQLGQQLGARNRAAAVGVQSARSILIAAAVVGTMLALFVVLVVNSTHTAPHQTLIPAGNSVLVVTGVGGGGTAPRAL